MSTILLSDRFKRWLKDLRDERAKARITARLRSASYGNALAEHLMTQFTPFDASEFLETDAAIAEYLAAALEDSDPQVFLAALGDVAKARGMTQIARASGLGRESLYKAFSPGSKLRYETVRKVMDGLGVKLTVIPQS